MKALFAHIGHETAEYHPAVRFFIYLVLATIVLCAIALIFALATSPAPEIHPYN